MSKKNPLWYELPSERWAEKTNEGQQTWVDAQRSKLYRAESAFRAAGSGAGYNYQEFGTIEAAQKYANSFLKSAWVKKRFPKKSTEPVTVQASAGHRSAYWRAYT